MKYLELPRERGEGLQGKSLDRYIIHGSDVLNLI